MKSFDLFISSFFLLFFTATASFICNSSLTATCQSLVGYIPTNSTTLRGIQSLFQVTSLPSLLGANNLSLSTPSSKGVPANSTIFIPFPCKCSNGNGTSDHTPVYTFKATDPGLDAIARNTFGGLVTYQEIGEANKLKDVNLITKGEKLWIPLPCSCDPVEEEVVVHLGHVVAMGSSVAAIAAEFGTQEDVLLKLNGMTDPKKLLAGQVLDVPLKACSSSIKKNSLDYNLRLSKDTYALTAENCIQCSCSSSNYQLSCHPIQGLNKSECPVSKCSGGQFIGNSTANGCSLTTCAYEGYTNATGLDILRSLVTQPTCNNGPAPSPAGSSPPSGNSGSSPPSGSSASRMGMQGHQIGLLLLLQIAFVGFSFLA